MENRFKIRTFLLCMCGSVLIWFMNKLNQPNYTEEILYPITFRYDDSLYVPTLPLPQSTKIEVQGSGWALLRQKFPAIVEPIVYTIQEPLLIHKLDKSTIKQLLHSKVRDLVVKEISYQDSTSLQFEKKAKKEVRLVVDSLNIDLQKNFVVSSIINITPRFVTFEGPISQIVKLNKNLILRLPQKRISNNFDENIPIVIPSQLPLLKTNTDKALVSFEVGEILNQILSDSTLQKTNK